MNDLDNVPGGASEPQHPGFQIAGTLKIGGCILVLAITVAALAIMLTSGRNPIKGYEPPESSEYYAMHIEELESELAENVFPLLDNVEAWEVENGRITVTLTGGDYAVSRAALLRYYDAELFNFILPE